MTVPGSTTGSSVTLGKVPVQSTRPGHTALYRFFSADGALLYVGITKRLTTRFREHSNTSKWWPVAHSHSVEWYATRTLAGRSERAAISDEKPLHNVLHTPRARLPIADRSSREYMTEDRGNALLLELKEHFKGKFFTAADAHAVSKLCRSSVEKNIQVLTTRELILPVGTRNVVPSKGGRKTSRLYTLPVHEWVDQDSGLPLPPDRIPDVQPKGRPRKPAPIVKVVPVPVEPRPIPDEHPLPAFVTFASGAKLLKKLDLVDQITPDGIRYIARTSSDWPFGEGRPHPYVEVGAARTMQTGPFLDFFRTGVRRGGNGLKKTHGGVS